MDLLPTNAELLPIADTCLLSHWQTTPVAADCQVKMPFSHHLLNDCSVEPLSIQKDPFAYTQDNFSIDIKNKNFLKGTFSSDVCLFRQHWFLVLPDTSLRVATEWVITDQLNNYGSNAQNLVLYMRPAVHHWYFLLTPAFKVHCLFRCFDAIDMASVCVYPQPGSESTSGEKCNTSKKPTWAAWYAQCICASGSEPLLLHLVAPTVALCQLYCSPSWSHSSSSEQHWHSGNPN